MIGDLAAHLTAGYRRCKVAVGTGTNLSMLHMQPSASSFPDQGWMTFQAWNTARTTAIGQHQIINSKCTAAQLLASQGAFKKRVAPQ